MFLLLEEYWFCMSIVYICLNDGNLNKYKPYFKLFYYYFKVFDL